MSQKIINVFFANQFMDIGDKKKIFRIIFLRHCSWRVKITFFLSYFSALIKQVNKSIDGTADDEDEGVPTDQAIRAGLELLKVSAEWEKGPNWGTAEHT